jgi:hypothetical protein
VFVVQLTVRFDRGFGMFETVILAVIIALYVVPCKRSVHPSLPIRMRGSPWTDGIA